jgi:hypothetical protein
MTGHDLENDITLRLRAAPNANQKSQKSLIPTGQEGRKGRQ